MQGQVKDTEKATQVALTTEIILPFAEIAAAYAAVREDRQARPEPVLLPIPDWAVPFDGVPFEEAVLAPVPIASVHAEGAKHATPFALRFKDDGEPLTRIVFVLPEDTDLAQAGYEKLIERIVQKPALEAPGIFGQEHPVSVWSVGVSISLDRDGKEIAE